MILMFRTFHHVADDEAGIIATVQVDSAEI
jgi:hypothetical protein